MARGQGLEAQLTRTFKLTWTWESNTTKMERDRWPTYKEGYFAVKKVSCNSHKTKWGPIQHIFSWTLVKAADDWLNTLWLFCNLTCYTNTTLLSILVKLWNVSVNFCVHINNNNNNNNNNRIYIAPYASYRGAKKKNVCSLKIYI